MDELKLAKGLLPELKARRILDQFVSGSKTFDDAKQHARILVNYMIGGSREAWIEHRWLSVLEELEKIESL